MPTRLPIGPEDLRALRKEYLRGATPADLANSKKCRDLGLTLSQVQNLVTRQGWAKLKADATETKRKAASEALEQVRADTVDELETVLRRVKTGLVNDAAQLEDGWDLVADAAGASSLMRAKALHLNRALRLYGLEKPPNEKGGGLGVAVVFARFGGVDGGGDGVAATRTEFADIGAATLPQGDSAILNFEDDEHDETD